ncbi:MAG TPA: SDR family NAD(P)-dependent oxidoreductase, partial [Spongiibacteraceae bacterium]|nr:SDR family NAD(P)-dependent oxidoreductase [Spongiibacteraceae bacterium]
AKKAQSELLAEVPNANAIILPLDVSEPKSIREFAHLFAEQVGHLDLLVNNAGIAAIRLQRNSCGQEMQLATNYLGTFALTGLLLPYFSEGSKGRIVSVGSLAHRMGKLNLDDLNWEKTPYDKWQSYARSKLATLSFTTELNRRLRASGSNIIALGAHPGFASTDILRHTEAAKKQSAFGKWIETQQRKLIPTPAKASEPIVHAAVAEDVQGDDYYGPRGFLEIAGKTGKARVNPIANNPDIGKRLWTLSEAMTGVKFLSEL